MTHPAMLSRPTCTLGGPRCKPTNEFLQRQFKEIGIDVASRIDALIAEASGASIPPGKLIVHALVVDDAMVRVVHDSNPHALSPRIKQFLRA